jgi:acyl-CoA thioester hydrolase
MTFAAPSFSHPVRIYWEDTDAGGLVYYANYLKFFERARTEWLRSCGIDQRAWRERDGLMVVVHEAHVRWHGSARIDDLLDITVSLAAAPRAKVVLEQSAMIGTVCLVDATVTLACVDAVSLSVRRFPPFILERIQAA